MPTAAAGSNDTTVNSIALELVCIGKFTVQGSATTCLSCRTSLWSIST